MTPSLDQFFLAQVEKGYQFIQKHLGIRLCSIIDNLMIVLVLSFWLFIYHFSKLQVGPIGPLVLFGSMLTIVALVYIFLLSSHTQAETERRASQGISNPLKINLQIVVIRIVTSVATVAHLIMMLLFGFSSTASAIGLTLLSYLVIIYLMSIDILPPGDSKAGNWLKNLFRKVSLST